MITPTELQDAVTASVSVAEDGGNPGAFRKMTHKFLRQTAPDFVAIWVSHINLDATYDLAADGPVDHIRYTEDRIKIAPHGADQVATGSGKAA